MKSAIIILLFNIIGCHAFGQLYSRRYNHLRPDKPHHVISAEILGSFSTFASIRYEYIVRANAHVSFIPKVGVSLMAPGRFIVGGSIALGPNMHKLGLGANYVSGINTGVLSIEYRFFSPRSGFSLSAGAYYPVDWGFIMPGLSLGKSF